LGGSDEEAPNQAGAGHSHSAHINGSKAIHLPMRREVRPRGCKKLSLLSVSGRVAVCRINKDPLLLPSMLEGQESR
jgi:hypothetical protein